jgi:hypothetical protein
LPLQQAALKCKKIVHKKMTTENKRLERLRRLLAKLDSGVDVQSRDLKNALTSAEWTNLGSWWTDEKENRNVSPPADLAEYIKRKKKVALANARSQRYSSHDRRKLQPSISRRLAEEVDSATDKLLEYLKDRLTADPALIAWLTPEEPFGTVWESIDRGVLPLVSTSRTAGTKRSGPTERRTKRDLKRLAIEQAIDSIQKPEEDLLSTVAVKIKGAKKKKDFSSFKF